jgi:hypothetical protein
MNRKKHQQKILNNRYVIGFREPINEGKLGAKERFFSNNTSGALYAEEHQQ